MYSTENLDTSLEEDIELEPWFELRLPRGQSGLAPCAEDSALPTQSGNTRALMLCIVFSLLIHATILVIRNSQKMHTLEPVIELSITFTPPHAPGNSDSIPSPNGDESASAQAAFQGAQKIKPTTPTAPIIKTSNPIKQDIRKGQASAKIPPKRIPKEPHQTTTPQTPDKPSKIDRAHTSDETVATAASKEDSFTGTETADSEGLQASTSGNNQIDGSHVSARGGRGKGGGDGQPLQFGSQGGPSFLHRVMPQYPRLAIARQEQGTVLLLLHIDANGNLTQANIMASAGPRLDEAALESVKASTYRPASSSGIASPCKALLPIRFTLKS